MKLLILTTLLFTTLSLAAQTNEASDIASRASKPYRTNSSFIVKFRAGIGSSDMKSTEGTLFVSGDKYRVNTEKSELFYDGQNRYNYIKENDELYIEALDLEKTSDIMSSPQRLLRLAESKDVKIVTVKDGVTVLSFPSQKITAYVRADNSLWKIDIEDENSKTVTLEVVSLDTKAVIDESLFVFDKSKFTDIEVIDLR